MKGSEAKESRSPVEDCFLKSSPKESCWRSSEGIIWLLTRLSELKLER